MIRNVVLVRMPQDADDEAHVALEKGLRGIAALDLPGQLATSVGLDRGLREGGWSAAIVNDWADADAYRRYDLDEEHNVHRAAIVAVAERVARVQFEVSA